MRSISCMFFLIIFCVSAESQSMIQKPGIKSKWKYITTAHKLLNAEEEVSLLPPTERSVFYSKMYKTIDDLIDSTGKRMRYLLNGIPITTVTEALKVLKVIDSTLIEQNFIVCITTEKLSDALTSKKLGSFSCTKFLTGYSRLHAEQYPQNDYFGIDCDLGGILYLAIAEVYNLPLKIVEVLNHNFIRWKFVSGDYINWDNNSGRAYSDDYYRNGLTPTSHISFTKSEEINNHYLEDLTIPKLSGYYTGLIAEYLNIQQRYPVAIRYFEESIAARPYDAISLNNLSWMILTVPELKSDGNYRKAFILSSIVDSLLPSEKNYKDTYSCACAAIGDFKKAIEIEKLAFNKPEKIEGFMQGKNCLDLNLK